MSHVRVNRWSVSLVGGRRLRRTLKAAGSDLSEFKTANRQAAQTVATHAGYIAPVGGPYPRRGKGRPRTPGRLKKSLRVRASNTSGVVVAGGVRVPYAGPVHWGWPRTPGRQGSGIKPHPFLTTAARATEHKWIKEYKRHIKRATKQVKGL